MDPNSNHVNATNPSHMDQVGKRDSPATRKGPALATLFEPGHYLIQREIMMCLDRCSFRKLKAAAKDINIDFYHNLRHHTTDAHRCCQERPDRDAISAISCDFREVRACEGFELQLPSGRAHGPMFGVCTDCNASQKGTLSVQEELKFSPYGRTYKMFSVPFRRLDGDVAPPKDPCECAEIHSKLHLCKLCRDGVRKKYLKAAKNVARKDPKCMEYIIPYEPEPSRTHVFDYNSFTCHKCIDAYEDWMDHKEERFLPYTTFHATHTTGEPMQTLQCLNYNGYVRGVVVIGQDANGGQSHFGVGQGIRNDPPCIATPDLH
jgi:hypothetical protein